MLNKININAIASILTLISVMSLTETYKINLSEKI